ncbi:hypothetical protein PIB30_054983 [Stylosanthes scabra]|uniref:Uncharacterized protein n=1 Tax=Stylosanthes scabra TaxID=79078 RepID=A0ABU6VI82_9FABA|nr:hypothetical protein [Stylosanthes scabra]
MVSAISPPIVRLGVRSGASISPLSMLSIIDWWLRHQEYPTPGPRQRLQCSDGNLEVRFLDGPSPISCTAITEESSYICAVELPPVVIIRVWVVTSLTSSDHTSRVEFMPCQIKSAMYLSYRSAADMLCRFNLLLQLNIPIPSICNSKSLELPFCTTTVLLWTNAIMVAENNVRRENSVGYRVKSTDKNCGNSAPIPGQEASDYNLQVGVDDARDEA